MLAITTPQTIKWNIWTYNKDYINSFLIEEDQNDVGNHYTVEQ